MVRSLSYNIRQSFCFFTSCPPNVAYVCVVWESPLLGTAACPTENALPFYQNVDHKLQLITPVKDTTEGHIPPRQLSQNLVISYAQRQLFSLSQHQQQNAADVSTLVTKIAPIDTVRKCVYGQFHLVEKCNLVELQQQCDHWAGKWQHTVCVYV